MWINIFYCSSTFSQELPVPEVPELVWFDPEPVKRKIWKYQHFFRENNFSKKLTWTVTRTCPFSIISNFFLGFSRLIFIGFFLDQFSVEPFIVNLLFSGWINSFFNLFSWFQIRWFEVLNFLHNLLPFNLFFFLKQNSKIKEKFLWLFFCQIDLPLKLHWRLVKSLFLQ